MKVLILFIATFIFAQDIIPIYELHYNKQKALLGKKLFTDKILSQDKSIACVNCHKFNKAGADNKQFSIGVYHRIDKPMNSQAVFNSVFNIAFFWNGRAQTLQQQALMALKAHTELSITPKEVEKRLNSNLSYKKLFKTIYHTDVISIDLVTDAIAEFEKALTTPNSKFDLFLKHKISLSSEEKRGYRLFKKYGCIVCHNGVNLGSNSFQKIGVVIEDYNMIRGRDRFEVTKDKDDKYVYKVPSLRNIALTAPYFHDGSVKTLKEAIEKMGYYNLGIILRKKDIDNIESFLKTLTGQKPKILDVP